MVLGPEASMSKEVHDWDIFLAHAGADAANAEELYELLKPCKVFLDSRCLLLGDNWDQELPRAQRRSLITVVLVSGETEAAYYQREEIAAAIDMARSDSAQHRVVPVYLHGSETAEIPYGLRLKHGIRLQEREELAQAADRLRDLVRRLKNWDRQIVEPQRRVLSRLTASSRRERFAGLMEIMQFFRPVSIVLAVSLLLTLLLSFVCLMIPGFEPKTLAVTFLGAIGALILLSMTFVFHKALNVSQQIVATSGYNE